MTKEELLVLLMKDLESYLPNCAESVIRNNHMNDMKPGEEIMPVVAREILERFVTAVPNYSKDVWGTIDVLNSMSECAKIHCPPLGNKVIDALVIDFINYVAGLRCVDYGMYTKDLRA